MVELSDLPQAELEIMEIIWAKGEVTTRDVFVEINKKRPLAYKTVGTLMTRLKERGYVKAEERNFAYHFRPLVPREQVVYRKVDDLVNRVLGGDISPLMLYMAKHGEKLTSEQIAALEAIVEQAKSKDGDQNDN